MKTLFTILLFTFSFSFYSQINDESPQIYLSGNSSKLAKLGDGKLVVKQKLKSGEFLSYSVIGYTIYVPGLKMPLEGKGDKIKPNYIKLIKNSGAKQYAIDVKCKNGNNVGNVTNTFKLK